MFKLFPNQKLLFLGRANLFLFTLHDFQGLENTVLIVMMCSSHPPDSSVQIHLMPAVLFFCWDGGGRGDFSGDKHKVPGAARERGTTLKCVKVCTRTWLRHCWLWCSSSPTSAREVRCFGGFFMTQHDWYFTFSATIWEMNASVSPVYVTALLGKSTATDFLQKVRERRSSECFPGGCSTEISEAGELIEADVGFVSSLTIVLSLTFDAVRGFPLENSGPRYTGSLWGPQWF